MGLGHKDVKVIDISHDDTVVKALKKDPAHDQEEALKDIYRKLRPGDPPTVANAKALLKRRFFDPKKYDLGRVGRYKINQKLGIDVDLGERIVTDKDFIGAIKYLINLRRGEGTLDDIDHLGSRRVRTASPNRTLCRRTTGCRRRAAASCASRWCSCWCRRSASARS